MAIPDKPSISTLPPVPQRTDTPTDFSSKADTFVAALPTFRQQTNTAIDWQNMVFSEIEAMASAVEEAAVDAALIEQHKDSAEAAAAAAQDATGLPALTGRGGFPLVVRPDESGVSYAGIYQLASIAATSTLDLAQQQVFRVDASTARTLTFANAPGADRAMTVVVHIGGNSAVTWPGGIDWDSDAAPELGDNETKVVLMWDGVEWSGFVRVAK